MGAIGTWTMLVALIAGQSAEPVEAPLRPSAPWEVAFEESMCVLSREYGSGDARVSLALRPLPGDEGVEIVLVSPGTDKRFRAGKARVALAGAAPVDTT